MTQSVTRQVLSENCLSADCDHAELTLANELIPMPAAEMASEQQTQARLASLEGSLSDTRAVITLLLAERPSSPPCADVPLPVFVRFSVVPRLSSLAMHVRHRSFRL